MATKEECEKALKEMNEAFYGITFLRSETRRFDDNLNLLRELVNEHFEEKQESNFEHFFEYLATRKIGDIALIDGRVTQCLDIHCSECDFNGDCIEKKFKWLKQPYKKPIYKLSRFEFDLLNSYKVSGMRQSIFNYSTLLGLQEKGYFKDINTSIPIYEILDNCEVIE